MATFTPEQGKALADLISKRVQKATKKGLLSTAMRLIGVIQNELIPAESPPPIFNRAYTAAWMSKVIDRGIAVVNTIPYAPIIEWGARAENIKIGRLMIDALTKWVQVKGLAGDDAEARQIAWAIAVTMTRKGIFNREGGQGLRIAEKAAKRAPNLAAEEFKREFKKEFK